MVVVCGLIGSGKSTWAAKNFKTVIEFEKYGSKQKQMKAAQALIEKGRAFAYVTCYPTKEEREFFSVNAPGRYVLIDTDQRQARMNILARRRKGDEDIIKSGFKQNKLIADLIYRSEISFERINVFKTNEKW